MLFVEGEDVKNRGLDPDLGVLVGSGFRNIVGFGSSFQNMVGSGSSFQNMNGSGSGSGLNIKI